MISTSIVYEVVDWMFGFAAYWYGEVALGVVVFAVRGDEVVGVVPEYKEIDEAKESNRRDSHITEKKGRRPGFEKLKHFVPISTRLVLIEWREGG